MSRREEIPQPRRRWRFGPSGPEEIAPPPASPAEAPSFDSAAIMREGEAHFTPGPDVEEEASCRQEAILPPEESGTNVQ
ncbi:MAG TPA: hypothetical protein GX715_18590 [Armatimonadetes bacterium]|nr:hypothetical protein [Armatimonadota bacterium]